MCRVAPRAGAWIETLLPVLFAVLSGSPPARGRGLKLFPFRFLFLLLLSPPARGRGLKLLLVFGLLLLLIVAPRAGAWIETVYVLA